MNKINKVNEFGERQLLARYKYGLHCYIITLFLITIDYIVRKFFYMDFENRIYFLLMVLSITGSYYIFRIIISDSFAPINLPKKWVGKSYILILIMIITSIMSVIRGILFKEHTFTDILNDKIIYSDFIENFALQFISFTMLISLLIRYIYDKCSKNED